MFSALWEDVPKLHLNSFLILFDTTVLPTSGSRTTAFVPQFGFILSVSLHCYPLCLASPPITFVLSDNTRAQANLIERTPAQLKLYGKKKGTSLHFFFLPPAFLFFSFLILLIKSKLNLNASDLFLFFPFLLFYLP